MESRNDGVKHCFVLKPHLPRQTTIATTNPVAITITFAVASTPRPGANWLPRGIITSSAQPCELSTRLWWPFSAEGSQGAERQSPAQRVSRAPERDHVYLQAVLSSRCVAWGW